MPDLSIPESGFVTVEIGGQTARVDAYRAYNQLLVFDREARAEFPDPEAAAERQVAYLDRVCVLLAGCGLPDVSHWAADRFDDQICKAVDELGKAAGTAPTPDSPASTASVPSS
jgi:hypothetical protein